jgi:hypothetical protein
MPLKGPRGVELLQGESFTLRASAAATVIAGATGTAVSFLGERRRFIILCDITASATEAGDVLDVYVDCSPDGTTWTNAIHFTQQAGNGAAKKMFAVLDSVTPAATVTDVTSDAASGAVRASLFGQQMRARWTVVEANANANASHTFSVTGWAE